MSLSLFQNHQHFEFHQKINLYNTVILKDIVERNSIKDVNLLNRVIQFNLQNYLQQNQFPHSQFFLYKHHNL